MSMWEPPEAEKIFTCELCGEDICNGEECYDIDGEKYHEECVKENAFDLLLEHSDISKHTASSDDLDDGSDAAYEYYRDEVRCCG